MHQIILFYFCSSGIGGMGGLGGGLCGGGLSGIGGMGGLGGLGGLGGGLGGLGGLGGGLGGPICGIPIGFGVTTTAGGLNPYTSDILLGGATPYGPYLGPTGIPPRGVGGLGGAVNRTFGSGPYRPF